MSQSSSSQRDRRSKAPPQSGEDRQPEKDARSRRSASGGTQTSQKFNPGQFGVTSDGLVSIIRHPLPALHSPIDIIGAYGPTNKPTVTVAGGILVLQLGLNNVIYPAWRSPGHTRLGSGGSLELFFTSSGAASVTAKVESFNISVGATIPTSPNATESKSVSIDGGKSSMLSFSIGIAEGISSINFRITFTSIGAGTAPQLYAASLAHLSEYSHRHAEAKG
tara:strand:+ start:14699 stop:15361 length:663 start_codon:yes stop_codon:yes gene_type:complete